MNTNIASYNPLGYDNYCSIVRIKVLYFIYMICFYLVSIRSRIMFIMMNDELYKLTDSYLYMSLEQIEPRCGGPLRDGFDYA